MAKAGKQEAKVKVKNYIQQERDGGSVQEEFTTNTQGYFYEVGDATYIEYVEEITENPVNVRIKFVGDDQVTIRRQALGKETTMNFVKGTKTDILYPIADRHMITFQGLLTHITSTVKDKKTFEADISYNLYQAGEIIGQYQIELQSTLQV